LKTFTEKLETLKAYRKERENLADRILEHPEKFEPLLNTCFQIDETISFKAAWVLELVCIQKPQLLYPHLELFISGLPKVYKHQAVRPLAKICEVLLTLYYKNHHLPTRTFLTKSHREQLTEICFDWLISSQKVAAKAYAMQCLFLLGRDFNWVHPELKIILEKDFSSEQLAFKARARHILKKLS
jgi:hypothetical protein